MDMNYEDIENGEIQYEDEYPENENIEDETIVEESDDDEFADVVKELKYQLNFSEVNRKYINVKIGKKKIKVIPIVMFKKSGSFMLKTVEGELIKAKKEDIKR